MVRCADCGYLAFYHLEHSRHDAAPENTRQTGEYPKLLNPSYRPYPELPICFARAASLKQEANGDPKRILEVIQKERTCDRFVEWLPDCSPKDHQDMEQAREMREWQERQRRNDRLWNIGQAVFVVILSALISWAVSTFAARDKGQPPIHVHIDNPKTPSK